MSIPITGVPSTFRVPGGYAELLFAQGPATANAGVRSVIFVMPMSSAGTWTANTVYEARNEGTVRDGAGVGSPMHRAVRKFLENNRTAKVYCLPYAASSGAGVATATGTITLASNATASGVVTATICGVECQAGFVKDDTPTTIGDALAASINAKDWLPCTANNVTGTITLTARIAGKSQGDGTLPTIRYRVEITSGIGTTATAAGAALGIAATAGADGATTEAANHATALAVINSARYYWIGCSVVHTTEFGQVETHVSAKSEPRPGLRSTAVVASNHTLAATQTLANARNYERLRIVWQKNSEHDPAELVGNALAVLQKRYETDPTANLDGYRGSDWNILPAYSQADWPDSDDQNDAINDGILAIASDQSGSYIVMDCTTRSKNAAGTVDDFRATEGHRIYGADVVVDRMLNRFALQFGNKKLKSDETLSDGSVNANQKLPPNTVTPSTFKPWIKQELQRAGDDAILQEVEASKESLRVERDEGNGGRLACGMDLHVIDLLHQATFRFAEVSSG